MHLYYYGFGLLCNRYPESPSGSDLANAKARSRLPVQLHQWFSLLLLKYVLGIKRLGIRLDQVQFWFEQGFEAQRWVMA